MPNPSRRAGRRLRLALACAAAPLSLLSCSRDDATAPHVAVTVAFVGTTDTVGVVGRLIDAPITARVADAAGRPVAGVAVRWEAPGGRLDIISSESDTLGRVAARWWLPTAAGDAHLKVVAADEDSATLRVRAVADAPATVLVLPNRTRITIDDTTSVRALLLDRYLNPVGDAAALWETRDTSVLAIDAAGLVRAHRNGSGRVVAHVGTLSGEATVGVGPLVVSFSLTPRIAMVHRTDTLSFELTARDAAGQPIPDFVAHWSSSDSSIAAVDGAGLVLHGDTGRVMLTVQEGDVRDTLPLAVAPGGPSLTADRLVAGSEHACAIVPDGRVACWGWNAFGQLGLGSALPRWYGRARYVPTPERLVSIAAGLHTVCGLTDAGVAYCWGDNSDGQIGAPPAFKCGFEFSQPCEPSPRRVSDNLSFRTLAPGGQHVCGLTTAGQVYCWGSNRFGQLGSGTPDVLVHSTPVLAASGRVFTTITSGWEYSCALDAEGAAWCWGNDAWRQLGASAAGSCVDHFNRTAPCSAAPVRVEISIPLASLRAGPRHACGMAAAGGVYCWGYNAFGEIGNGRREFDAGRLPTLLGGELSVRSISPSLGLTCVVTDADRGFCWGVNGNGELGDGTVEWSGLARPVFKSPSLQAIEAYGDMACALTTAREVLCWGVNVFGELGAGIRTNSSSIPVRVLQPQ